MQQDCVNESMLKNTKFSHVTNFSLRLQKFKTITAKNSMKNGVFSCGESKRLLKRSFIGKRSVNGCENSKHRLFDAHLFKCTTTNSEPAVKATALVKNER